MSRYITPTAVEMPRKKTVQITASDPAVQVPAWAQNGLVFVSGCAPGQGGANSTTAGQRGAGGNAGAYAIRVSIPVNGATTIAVEIGASSVGAPGSSNTNAAAAGNTTVTVGSAILTLEGGNPTSSSRAYFGPSVPSSMASNQGVAPFGNPSNALGLGASPSPLAGGGQPGSGSQPVGGYGAGAHSPFGAGGAGVSSVTANMPGGDGTGHGSGGAGSNGAGKAGDGAPSIIWIEFEEGA